MWNYNLVLPELVISATFFIFYFSQPRIPLKINKSFLFVLIIDTLTIVTDVGSSLCLEFFSTLPPLLLRIENIVFFLLFLVRIICFASFTKLLINKNIKNSIVDKLLYLWLFLIVVIAVIANLFTDIIFCISDNGEYSQGPFYFLLYICAFYYVSLSIIQTIISRKKIKRDEFAAILILNIILFIGYITRIIYPKDLIMNFFTLVSIIIIYLTFENPVLFKEEKSGLFNKKALTSLLQEMNTETYPLIIGFSLHNYKSLREIYSHSQTDHGLSSIGIYLRQNFPELLPFYIHDGHFVLIGGNIKNADSIKNAIRERFNYSWNMEKDTDIFLEISFMQLDSTVISDNRELLCTTIISTLNDIESKSQVNVIIKPDDVKKIEQLSNIKRAVEIAVEQNTIELFLQPVIDAKTQKLVGAESLARLRDSNGQYIPPFQFIPIAEKTGRINILGKQMFEKTCQFIKENDIDAMGLSWINVNLSPIQFLRRDLKNSFTTILKKYNVNSEKIHLEITEESMIDFDLLQSQMQSMNESGFKFVLDDYGRGYSNIARMKKCPFINIKLDMEFVWDYFKYKDKILPTMVQTIKQMGFTITAEGIENQELAEAMRDIGCDNLQGYYFSKPISIKEFVEKYGK